MFTVFAYRAISILMANMLSNMHSPRRRGLPVKINVMLCLLTKLQSLKLMLKLVF